MNRAEILEWAGTRISPTEQRYVLLAIATFCDETSHDATLYYQNITAATGLHRTTVSEAIYALWERYIIDLHTPSRGHGRTTYHLRIEGDTAP